MSSVKIQRILQSAQQAKYPQNLTEMYQLLEQVTSDVFDIYPHIACRTGCNTCCRGHSMPVVTTSEWTLVYNHILRFWTPHQQEQLVGYVLELHQNYGDLLWQVHEHLQNNDQTVEHVKVISDTLMKLEDTHCPLLVNDRCSVYASRPGKCRAHGAFLFIMDQYTQMHACQAEIDKMEKHLTMQGSRRIVMPIWNDFELRIAKDFNAPDYQATILAIWVYAHIKDGQLVQEINLKPDFESFRPSNNQ